jgi:hypothetical protein
LLVLRRIFSELILLEYCRGLTFLFIFSSIFGETTLSGLMPIYPNNSSLLSDELPKIKFNLNSLNLFITKYNPAFS